MQESRNRQGSSIVFSDDSLTLVLTWGSRLRQLPWVFDAIQWLPWCKLARIYWFTSDGYLAGNQPVHVNANHFWDINVLLMLRKYSAQYAKQCLDSSTVYSPAISSALPTIDAYWCIHYHFDAAIICDLVLGNLWFVRLWICERKC